MKLFAGSFVKFRIDRLHNDGVFCKIESKEEKGDHGMEGRRVEKRAEKSNPLYLIFIGLCAAVLVLLAMVIILGAKLRTANKELARAERMLELYEDPAQSNQQEGQTDDGSLPGDDTEATDPSEDVNPTKEDEPETKPEETKPDTNAETKIGWLDLTGHTEVKVAPKSVFDKYYTYYTTGGVNLRAGPGTDYDRIVLVNGETEVQGAAKDGGWTFVKVGNRFGWISADYLSTTKPETAPEAPAVKEPDKTGMNNETPADTQQPEEQAPAPEQPASDPSQPPEWLNVG